MWMRSMPDGYFSTQIIICVDNQFVMSGVVEMWYTEFVNKMLQHCIKLHNRKNRVKFSHSFPNYDNNGYYLESDIHYLIVI